MEQSKIIDTLETYQIPWRSRYLRAYQSKYPKFPLHSQDGWFCWIHSWCWYVSNVSIIFDCSMLYYLLFWTLLGFIIHFYIIFGTNLLTGGPAGMWFSERTWSRGLGPYVKKATRKPRGRGAPTAWACPPPSWAPCCSTDVLLPPIYTHVPPNDQRRSQNPNSTAVTFCIHEIPSWGLFRSSAGGGIDHGGLLHQHHSLSDEVWVVHLKLTGP